MAATISDKKYKCQRCGHIEKQSTNHYGQTYSLDHFNTCPKCPPWAKYPEFGGSTTWECVEKEGEEMAEKITILEAVKNEGAWVAADRAAGTPREGNTYNPNHYWKLANANRSVWARVSEETQDEALYIMPPMYCKSGFQVSEAVCSCAEGELFLTILNTNDGPIASYQTKKAAKKGFKF
jgi:hypothetical protein